MSASTTRAFTKANPHALATILAASETKLIIASQDIFDISGTKLWARDQPVSQSLQRKLMDRQLQRPLESCLIAEDGVTSLTLVAAVEAVLAAPTPLAPLLRPHASKLVREAAHVPLHPVAQLLLTAAQVSRPGAFDHALQAMTLAGALMLAHSTAPEDVRMAMLGGLLHDLGEMYIGPEYGEADADRTLDALSFRHLVVHPHVGRLLIEQLTNYPRAMARAVGEHHERMDGSGYPHLLEGDQISPMGRLLAVTEATLGTMRRPEASLTRASVALRVVPGEFDLGCVGPIAEASMTETELRATQSLPDLQRRLTALNFTLKEAQQGVISVLSTTKTASLKEALTLALHLLGRLRTGWNASGLWGRDAVTEQDALEIEAIEDELLYRLWSIQRAVRLQADKLSSHESARLNQLFENIAAGVS